MPPLIALLTSVLLLGILVGVPLVIIVAIYNSLVFQKNQVQNAFASIDVLLKKRYDLIPNLVAVVQNYTKYEEKILIEVTRLRAKVLSGEFTGNTRVQLENQITRAMGDFLALVETYPELKANQNFIYLLESLNEIEEQISAARRFYNTAVTDYNNAIQMFPTNLVAYRMNYRLIRLFEVSPASRQNVNVKNLFEQ